MVGVLKRKEKNLKLYIYIYKLYIEIVWVSKSKMRFLKTTRPFLSIDILFYLFIYFVNPN
jgi:hypothetical protein